MANSPRVPIRSSKIVESMTDINKTQRNNVRTGRPKDALGVFAAQPFSSAKYMRHRANRHHEFEETMARMFIKVAPDLYQKFLASLGDKHTRDIARVLAGDDNRKGGHGYLDFLLQSANHSFEEKFQVSETLSDNYVAFFFGHAPPVFQYSGTLMNTYQDDWTMSMFRIFRDLARGTQLARRNLVLRLKYDSMIVTGAMTNLQWATRAGMETYSPFSFNLLVKSIHVIYGRLAPPTKFRKQEAFTPAGTNLTGSGVGDFEASQTYMGKPSTNEEAPAVSDTQVPWDVDFGVSDPTQTQSQQPPEWAYDVGLVDDPYGRNTEEVPQYSGYDEFADGETPQV